jgi:ribosomal protein S18 acetylase RimI-like enzyme
MFRDMGDLAPDREAAMVGATALYLRDALPRGEYLAWIAESAGETEIIAGVGAQLRPILPRPGSAARELELGPEAIILNVYVERKWRRQGVAEALMRELLDDLAGRGIRRIVLHASPDGRRLYERMGFESTNEMRLRSQ